MLGEGLYSGESQFKNGREISEKSIYTKSQQKPSLLLPFQAEQIVLLFCYCIFFLSK